MGSDWRRSFHFVIPVRNPIIGAPIVLESFCDTLSFLSEDDYAFEFENATNPLRCCKYYGTERRRGAHSTPTKWCCFPEGSIPSAE